MNITISYNDCTLTAYFQQMHQKGLHKQCVCIVSTQPSTPRYNTFFRTFVQEADCGQGTYAAQSSWLVFTEC